MSKIRYIYHTVKGKLICKIIKKSEDKKKYVRATNKTTFLELEEINANIYTLINSNQPFMVGRFGANELSVIKAYDFSITSKYNVVMQYLVKGAGFFPLSSTYGEQFKNLMISLIKEADVMGLWMLPFENYYLKKYGSKTLKTSYLLDLEPWSYLENPWSAALAGKKVLVIHPFAETIKSQYMRREEIFPGSDVLPEFDLKVLKAVQTIAGEKDERFETWFDALEWMYQEALKIDFDVAIIGCGAYGFPLACKLKQAGKQAIHLGGALQLMFGIKGKRWEEEAGFEYVRKCFNDAWVYPSDTDKPEQAKDVEGGCYW